MVLAACAATRSESGASERSLAKSRVRETSARLHPLFQGFVIPAFSKERLFTQTDGLLITVLEDNRMAEDAILIEDQVLSRVIESADASVEKSAGDMRLFPAKNPMWWRIVMLGVWGWMPLDSIQKLADSVPRKAALFHTHWIGRLNSKFHGNRQTIVRKDGQAMVHDFTENLLPVLTVDFLKEVAHELEATVVDWKGRVLLRTRFLLAVTGFGAFTIGWLL